jgi:predicted Zn-dependent peptidase
VRRAWVVAMSLVTGGLVPGAAQVAVQAAQAAEAGNPNVVVPASVRATLGNGLKLVMVPRHELPLVAFDFVLRGGARLDPQGHEGTASLVAELLSYGAGRRDAYAFVDAVEGAGGSLGANAGNESLRVRGQFLARDTSLMLDLLADAVQRPRLAQEEFTKLQERHIEELKAAKDSEPQALLSSYGRALLFGAHPYGRSAGGSEASLARVTIEDVRRYVAEEFGADRATLVIAGDFDPKAMQAAVQRAFGDWRKAARPLSPLPEPARVRGRRILLVDAPGSAQSYFWLGNVGVARRYPQRAPLQVANTAFGGSFGSMLNQELRVKAGLTYGASSGFNRGSVPGEFAISTFTQTPATARALQLTLDTLAGLHSGALAPERIESSRRYLLGQYPLSFETSADWAVAFGDLEFFGLPESYYGQFGSDLLAVNEAAVRAQVASEFPSADDLAIVVIGDAKKIRDELAKFGPVTEMPLASPEFSPGAAAPKP